MTEKPSLQESIYLPPRLRSELKKITSYPLTLIEAGSGFGKTTAVDQHLRSLEKKELAVHWYTCLNEPPEAAWKHICALFRRVNPRIAELLEKLIVPTASVMAEVGSLMRELSCLQETVLVIDNYQQLPFEDLLNLLRAFALHRCESLHIVVITQPLSRTTLYLAPSSMVHFIDQQAFYFSLPDIIAFFKGANLPLKLAEAKAVFRVTEGWIAALRLHLQHYRETSNIQIFPGLGLLLDAVFWDGLDESERFFFMQLCPFDAFTPALAAAALRQSSLDEHQHLLLCKTAFIRWDDMTERYTLHSLLQSYLQKKLACEDAELRQQIVHRCAVAYRAGRDHVNAARFFNLCGDYAALLELPFTDLELDGLVRYHSDTALAPLLAHCPAALWEQHPETLLRFSFEYLLQGKQEHFGELFEILQRLEAQPELFTAAQYRRFSGQFALLCSFTVFNDIAAMSAYHHKAADLLDHKPADLFAATGPWTFGIPSVLCLFWHRPGELDNTLCIFEQCMPCYYELTRNHGYGATSALQAEICLYRGDIPTAEMLCYRSLYLAERCHQDSICFCAELTLARIAILRGDIISFQNLRKDIQRRVFEGHDAQAGLQTAELSNFFLDMILKQSPELPAWLQDLHLLEATVYDVALPFSGIISLCHHQRTNKILFEAVIDSFLAASQQANMLLPQIYYLIFLAIDKEQQNCREEALSCLHQALDLALPDRIHLPFAEFAADLEPLLRLAQRDRAETKQVKELMLLVHRMKNGIQKLKQAQRHNTVALTAREREIAQLAQKRLTAKEISLRLDIAESTARNTLRRIYEKLSIHSRAELEQIPL